MIFAVTIIILGCHKLHPHKMANLINVFWLLHQLTISSSLSLSLDLPFPWDTTILKFSSIQSLSHVWLFANPWTAAPGLPVHHQLPEFTQIRVHWVGDAIQPSHPLSSSSLTFNLSQHQGLFKYQFFASGGQSTVVSDSASVLPMNIQDWFPLGWTAWISLQWN